jgi:hypothetical protein
MSLDFHVVVLRCCNGGRRLCFPCSLQFRSRDSSVSIVSGYGLDDRAIGVRSAAWAKNFSSNLCVQTDSEAHSASCTMGAGGPFPGAKRGSKLCRQQAEVIQNHVNPNVRNIVQGEAQHRKYKRIKLGGGQAYDRSSESSGMYCRVLN